MNNTLHYRFARILIALVYSALCFFVPLSATEFASSWSGQRTWIGPEYWANPLTDWRVEGQDLIGIAAGDRTLHHLSHQVVNQDGNLQVSVQLKLNAKKRVVDAVAGGFRIGNQGKLDDYRHVLIYSTQWLDAGIRADGRLVLDDKVSERQLNPDDWVDIVLTAKLRNGSAELLLVANQRGGHHSIELSKQVPSSRLLGNLALLSGGSGKLDRENASEWHFRDWKIAGSVLADRPDQTFGPILWSQYTLSRGTMKLLAMMAPVETTAEPVRLEILDKGRWIQLARAPIDRLSRTALFRIDDWDDKREVAYRVCYSWQGKEYFWEGRIRRNPVDHETISMLAVSCDNGYIFPNSRIVENATIQDPDILYFAGDQIYESFGGFGFSRSPVELAMLDYLRKYWQFGWSWRDLLKDRPSVIIPDDHDVFQGNLWGHGGRRIPGLEGRPSGKDWPKGGYAMDPDWINAVERTQTASLPDPVDPRPADQGIGVYFTEMLYGGLQIAVIEDRKFKSGPKDPLKEALQLLGPRQEAFLKSWVETDAGDFKVVLSQTIFCDVATHTGQDLKKNSGGGGNDSNGWPKEKRDKALSILQGHKVLMVHGDQHLGALVHHGVEDWEDAAVAFMVPGSANGFPRAWWPEHAGENHQPGEPDWTGRYVDSQGNKMTVLAVANPEKGSNLLAKKDISPEIIGDRKGSGHGIIKFHKDTGRVTFEMWRLLSNAANPGPEDQFTGFPKTLELAD